MYEEIILKEWEESEPLPKYLFNKKEFLAALDKLQRRGIVEGVLRAGKILLKAKHFVGIFPLFRLRTKGLNLIIQPKIEVEDFVTFFLYSSGFRIQEIRNILLYLGREKIKKFGEILFFVIIREFLKCLQQALAWGFHAQEIEQIETSPGIKGKILISETITAFIKFSIPVAVCSISEQTIQTPVNYRIKRACKKLLNSKFSEWIEKDKKLINNALFELWEVDHTSSESIDIPLEREYLEKLFNLSNAIINYVGFGSDVGLRNCIYVDMNTVYEGFVRRLITETATEVGVKAKRSYEIKKYLIDEPERKIRLKPDIVLLKEGSIFSIVDAKYKQKILAETDLYQLLSYAIKFNVQKVGAIYPTYEKKVGKLERFRIKTDTKVVDIWTTKVPINDIRIARENIRKFLKSLIED